MPDQPSTSLRIRAVAAADTDAFFAYLDNHLSDNGRSGTALFQPMSRNVSRFPENKRLAFLAGLATPLNQPSWRRAWIAENAAGEIAGHIDLRARPEPATGHRALLGMGVHRDARRQGLGRALIDAAVAWALAETPLAWIDLEVLSVNAAARQLYASNGFATTGEIPDMFLIDGEFYAYTLMSRKLRPVQPPGVAAG